MSNSNKKKILIQMSGSIACFKACAVISKLVQAGHHVKIAASPSALKFVGAATLEGLTGEKVHADLWEPGDAMAHIHLVRWADLIAVIPASAHLINRLSQGVGDDLLTTMFLAHDFKKPYLIAPAMNTSMYLHPVTQNSLTQLKSMGVEILEAASGVLACGEVGYGRLLEPDLLLAEIETRLQRDSFEIKTKSGSAPIHLRKVLVTSGGTQENIDDVRVLSNVSTGRTGAEIIDRLESLGLSTVLLHAQSALLPSADGERHSFVSSDDLEKLLQSRLAKGDVFAVIHLAAVSDFIPVRQSGKISSDIEPQLELRKNKKILPLIRSFSPNPIHLTAFKMTSGATDQTAGAAVAKVYEQSAPDWIVQNDLQEMKKTSAHPLNLWLGPTQDAVALPGIAPLVEKWVEKFSSLTLKTVTSKGEPL
ncbi:MAG: bifunctional phosphopantothenoylcysteine decarboxylase/phosphopantothenate--cysteine ligase CoaBC [Bdellovibrio sp.]|jgi:phosphopantothenoylcysteine decarboxylase/phosphopantothenate--cysteine ligase